MVDGESNWGGRGGGGGGGGGEVGPKNESKNCVVEGSRKSSWGDELAYGDNCRVREQKGKKEGKTKGGK